MRTRHGIAIYLLSSVFRGPEGDGGAGGGSGAAPSGSADGDMFAPAGGDGGAGDGGASGTQTPAAGADGAAPPPAPALGPDGKPVEAKAGEAPVALTMEDLQGIQAPDGFVLDPALATEFLPLANELGLGKEGAGKLAAFQAQIQNKYMTEFTKEVTAWEESARSDTELSKGNFDENISVAKAGMDALGATDKVKELLRTTGLGNHPDIIRMFYRAGRQLGEGTNGGGNSGGGQTRSAADVLYGS